MEISDIVTINLSVADIKEIIAYHLKSKGYHVNTTDFSLKAIPDPEDRFRTSSYALNKATCSCTKI